MPIGVLFWVIMALAIIGAFIEWRGPGGPYAPYVPILNKWVILILFFLVGWRIFGFIIQG